MKKLLLVCAAAAGLSTVSFAPDANAGTTFSLGGGMGSAAAGTCGLTRDFDGISVHSSGQITLPSGTYRPFMGASTSWNIKKSGTTDPSIPYAGTVKLEIIEVAVFGAETVRTAYVRSFDSAGVYASTITLGGPQPDNQEFGSFVASAPGSKYLARVTAWSSSCSFAHMINTRVELVSD